MVGLLRKPDILIVKAIICRYSVGTVNRLKEFVDEGDAGVGAQLIVRHVFE